MSMFLFAFSYPQKHCFMYVYHLTLGSVIILSPILQVRK